MIVQLDVCIDQVCPFCFLAEEAFEAVVRERDGRVNLRSFELRPDPVPTSRVEDAYLPKIWRNTVYPMAERLNVPMRLLDISPQPRTAKAFVVLQLAQERSKGAEYSSAIFRSFFQICEDAGNEEELRDVATRVGLDLEEFKRALRSEIRKIRQQKDQRWACPKVGGSSVPSVLFRGVLYPGIPGPGRHQRILGGARNFAPRG